MANPTKILKYDLDASLSKVFDDLDKVRGAFSTLEERFKNIDVEMLAAEERKIIQDLIDAYNNDGKGITSERLRRLEANLVSISADYLETGNFDEIFTYDEDDNIIKHESKGDRSFVVDYVYKEDDSGELANSTKTFLDSEGNTVEIYKVYTYTNGNITGIKTTTTVTPPEPVV